MFSKTRCIFLTAALLGITSNTSLGSEERSPSLVGTAVRHDTSAPLTELLQQLEQKRQSGQIPDIAPDFEIPNILQIDEGPAAERIKSRKPSTNRGVGGGSNGLPTAPVIISVDGFTAADDTTVVGGIPIPPDTNGDVGLQFLSSM